MNTVLHILPQNGIGGAELAACRAACDRDEAHAFFLKKHREPASLEGARITYGPGEGVFGPRTLRAAVQAVDALQPDVVVFSLWRTFGAFVVLRLLRPRRRFALFLHSERATHVVDRWLTGVMARLVHGVWADSKASLRRLGQRARGAGRARTRVVSFLMHDLEPTADRAPAPRFIYWGRLQTLKDIPRALDLFATLADRWPEAELRLIGPDAGMRPALEEQAVRLGIDSAVRFEGRQRFEEIVEHAKDACFFIQLSRQEGMAMSVVEAMRLGLVVVVTPVGEIARYCRDMENGVLYDGIEPTLAKIETLLRDPQAYRGIRDAAVAAWRDKPLYADDFVAAAAELQAAAPGLS